MIAMTNTKSALSLGYIHRFVPAREAGLPVLLLLHGTGGDENDLMPIGVNILPGAAMLSPRGNIDENGMNRFFKRFPDGSLDLADVEFRAHELADFIQKAKQHYSIADQKMIAVGYSNGANIAAALLLLHPDVLSGAILFRAMPSITPEILPDLAGLPILVSAGAEDSMIPLDRSKALVRLLERAKAMVTFHIEETGHRLTESDMTAAKEWVHQLIDKFK